MNIIQVTFFNLGFPISLIKILIRKRKMAMGRKQGVILSYILMIFEVLSTLLLTPFLLRTLGQAEFGVYKLVTGITAYLLLLDLGVGNSIVKFISQYRINNDIECEKKFVAVGLVFYITVAIIAAMAGVVLSLLFPTVFSKGLTADEIILGQKLLLLTMANATVTIGTTLFNNILIAYEKFNISKGFSIFQIIIRIILTFAVLKTGLGSLGVVLVNLLLTVLTRGFFVVYVFFILKVRPQYSGVSFDFIKIIIKYSSLILVQMVATQINASLDRILLGAFVASSAEIISVYSIGTQVVQYFQSIGNSFTGVLMPGVVRIVEQNASCKTICREMVRIGRLTLIVLGIIWSGFLVLGKQFVDLWAGTANSNAYYVAILLMTAYLFIAIEAIGTQILWAKNEHKEQSWMKLGIVLLNIVLTIFLIKWNPLLGATIGTFISLIIGDVIITNVVFVKRIGISLKQYYMGLFKGLWLCLLISVGAGFAINLLPINGWIGLIIKICLICTIYFVSLLTFGMNKYEKQLLVSLIKNKK